MKKYGLGLPTSYADEDVSEYAEFRTKVYEETPKWKESELSAYFHEDFGTFSEEMFGLMSHDIKRKLRNILRERGVYVNTDRNVGTHVHLWNTAQKELEWPEHDSNPLQPASKRRDPSTTQPQNTNRRSIETRSTPIQEETEDTEEEEVEDGQTPVTDTHLSRNETAVMYAYTKNHAGKFEGDMTDNLDLKLQMFHDKCDKAKLPMESRHLLFSEMLSGPALNFYLRNLKGKIHTIHEMEESMRKRFVTTEGTLALLREWKSTTLLSYMEKNPDKSAVDIFNKMVARLAIIQQGLPNEYQNDTIFKDHLLTAVDGIDACRLARQKVAPTLQGVISDLQTSIATVQVQQKPKDPPESDITKALLASTVALLTDRKKQFRKSDNFKGKRSNKKCFVCKKRGCWSTKHTKEERIASFRKNKQTRALIMGNQDESEEDSESSDEDDDIHEQLDELEALITLSERKSSEEGNGPKVFLTSCHNDACHSFISESRENIAIHALTKSRKYTSKRYSEDTFHGVAIDTCCAYGSTGGIAQFKAYCNHTGCSSELAPSKSGNVAFGMGETKPLGVGTIRFPVNGLTLSFKIQVVQSDIPILLGLPDMDRLKVSYDNQNDVLLHHTTGATAPVVREFGHPFIRWDGFMQCFYTENELQRLHRRFGHPSADKLSNLLKRADPEKFKRGTRKMLEIISRQCKPCQFQSQAPRRFKFTIRTEKNFNESIYIDVFFIDGKPILHVVDESTRYQAARWLPAQNAEEIWKALRLCWIDVYLGPPDIITHDAAKVFLSDEFCTNSSLLNIKLKPVPVEAANTMSFVERYHDPIRRCYRIVKSECSTLDEISALQMSVKAVNDSIGPDGLIPTLLVYGAIPRLGLPTDKPSPDMHSRALALRKATESMSRYFAKRQVDSAVKTRNGPDVSENHQIPIGYQVLVYRTKRKKWEGPYKLINRKGETYTLLMPYGPDDFRSTHVKQFFDENTPQTPIPTSTGQSKPPTPISTEPLQRDPAPKTTPTDLPPSETAPKPTPTDLLPENTNEMEAMLPPKDISPVLPEFSDYVPPWIEKKSAKANISSSMCSPEMIPEDFLSIDEIKCFVASFKSNSKPQSFEESRKKELDGLIERGGLIIVDKSEADGYRIYGSRFVDSIKNKGSQDEYHKSRLVVQAFKDKKHGLLTYSPTVQRASQRILYSFIATSANWDKKWSVSLRDISQAYTQSETEVMRRVYVRPPKEYGLPTGVLLRVDKPLYGLPEAGVHWFKTYHDHHLNKLNMSHAPHDLCLLFTPGVADKKSKKPNGISCLQTDDSLILGDEEFHTLEQKEAKRFKSNPISILKNNQEYTFNGTHLIKSTSGVNINASHHIKKIEKISVKTVDKTEYVAQRARGAYIATICRPDVTFAFSYAAQHQQDPTSKNARFLNKAISRCLKSPQLGLKYVPLDTESTHVAVFADASFANNSDYSSQLGFVACLMDKHNRANIINYSSIKSKRVTRSVLAAELYAIVHGFDYGYVLRHTIGKIIGTDVKLKLYTDSKCLFDSLISLNTTSEKRLMIDLSGLRQCYERREITEVLWIPGEQNPADVMTKDVNCLALNTLMEHNRLDINPKAWIERVKKKPTKEWVTQLKKKPKWAHEASKDSHFSDSGRC